MTEYVKYKPEKAGEAPPNWKKGMFACVFGASEKIEADWTWLPTTTYMVPKEAVAADPLEPLWDLLGAAAEEGLDISYPRTFQAAKEALEKLEASK